MDPYQCASTSPKISHSQRAITIPKCEVHLSCSQEVKPFDRSKWICMKARQLPYPLHFHFAKVKLKSKIIHIIPTIS